MQAYGVILSHTQYIQCHCSKQKPKSSGIHMITPALFPETESNRKSTEWSHRIYSAHLITRLISTQQSLNVEKIFTIVIKDSLRYFERTSQPCDPNNSRHD